MSGRGWHRRGVAATSAIIAVLGIVMIVSTVARGGGPLAAGVVLGLLFTIVGAGRLYTTARGG